MIRATKEDLLTPENARQHRTITKISCLHAPADRNFEPLTRPRRQLVRIKIHDRLMKRRVSSDGSELPMTLLQHLGRMTADGNARPMTKKILTVLLALRQAAWRELRVTPQGRRHAGQPTVPRATFDTRSTLRPQHISVTKKWGQAGRPDWLASKPMDLTKSPVSCRSRHSRTPLRRDRAMSARSGNPR